MRFEAMTDWTKLSHVLSAYVPGKMQFLWLPVGYPSDDKCRLSEDHAEDSCLVLTPKTASMGGPYVELL